MLGRDRHAEIAHLAERGHYGLGPPILVVHPRLERVKLLHEELLRLIADLALLGGELEVRLGRVAEECGHGGQFSASSRRPEMLRDPEGGAGHDDAAFYTQAC